MPGITMCSGESAEGQVCLIKNTCYRYTAIPSDYQSFMNAPIELDAQKGCRNFWDNGPRREPRGTTV